MSSPGGYLLLDPRRKKEVGHAQYLLGTPRLFYSFQENDIGLDDNSWFAAKISVYERSVRVIDSATYIYFSGDRFGDTWYLPESLICR